MHSLCYLWASWQIYCSVMNAPDAHSKLLFTFREYARFLLRLYVCLYLWLSFPLISGVLWSDCQFVVKFHIFELGNAAAQYIILRQKHKKTKRSCPHPDMFFEKEKKNAIHCVIKPFVSIRILSLKWHTRYKSK